MTQDVATPHARPARLPEGYRRDVNAERLLPWPGVRERLERAENYWLCTASVDGLPHATPVWGVWVDDTLIMDGHPATRWGRNIAANLRASIHLESGTDVVVVDGTVEDVVLDRDLSGRIVVDWNQKYGRLTPDPSGSGVFRFRPQKARAWTDFPADATTFDWDTHVRP